MATKFLNLIKNQIFSQYASYLTEQCIQQEGRKLDLSRLKLKELPAELTLAFAFLSKLSLEGNFLRFESIIVLHSLKFLRYLALNNNQLALFPEELCELKYVEFLNLSDNPIECLPEAIGKLKNVTTLWCNDMMLSQLPSTFGSLRKLKTFGARNNQLAALPESFGMLRRLKWLSLEGNHISAMPESFEWLRNLSHLNLKGNSFIEFPVELFQMRRLKFCSLANNSISALSEVTLEGVRFIDTLELSGNPANVSVYGNFENIQAKVLRLQFDLMDETVEEEWKHSLPNSELNSPDTSGDETDMEPYDYELPKLARYCCAV
ncbi:leucine-rich repeat-containing protein 57 [Topomyia yanbarensis]|uniref:leucine-rich repeat-containing protein 57 n=1 Tax=Topomyia yanbarensis TaxID=2498891 RepID=UPI00273A75F6|nr:leucine-rich repeat-containing protein 57 [Topomyia yanbarensis]